MSWVSAIDRSLSTSARARLRQPASSIRLSSLVNKISAGQSSKTAVIWRQSDGIILEKGSYLEKQKNMEENNSRTAPSSTDACNSIVHALMCRRQGGNLITFFISNVCLLRLRSLNFSLFLIFTFR